MRVKFSAADWEEFVRAWQASETLGEVCRRMRTEYHPTMQRGRILRAFGVPLKNFRRGKRNGKSPDLVMTPALVERLQRIARGEKVDGPQRA